MNMKWDGEPPSEVWLEVPVTKVHIEYGKQGMCSQCPLALAISEIVDVAYRVEVNTDEIEL